MRGYITPGPIPQHIQNLVIRDYAQRHGLTFELSATEYAMPNCRMMLEQAVREAQDGIILYSIHSLPHTDRRHIYKSLLAAGRELHAAVEDMSLRSADDIEEWEIIIRLREIMD